MNEFVIQNYRRYAVDCLTLAEKASDPDDRLRLIEMAAGWHGLAASLEKQDLTGDTLQRLRPVTFRLSSADSKSPA